MQSKSARRGSHPGGRFYHCYLRANNRTAVAKQPIGKQPNMNVCSPQTFEESHHQQFADQDFAVDPWPDKIVVDFSKTLDAFFADLFGEGVGYIAVSYGKVPNSAVFYEWPTEKNKLLAEAE